MKPLTQAGFSLTEAAVAGLIVALIAGFAIPQIQDSLSLYRLTASANLLATELNAGRTLAVSRTWLYEVNVDSANRTIQIVDPNDASNNPRMPMPLESRIAFSAWPSSGSEIRFYSRGHARAGNIKLKIDGTGTEITVSVMASGRITISDITG